MKDVKEAGVGNLVDGAALAERFKGRLDLLRQIVVLFERQAAESAEELRGAFEDGHAVRVRETAHRLVNAGGAVRATTFTETAKRLEDAARQGDLETAAALSAEALRLAREVAAWLRRLVEKQERDGETAG